MVSNGFVKLHRQILKWGWYTDANTFRVFVHLILTANFEQGEFCGRTVARGQRIASVSGLAKELKLSVRSVRTALSHLQSTNEVTIETTAKYSIITVKNYGLYQSATNAATNKRQTDDKQVTNDRQQYKNKKKEKKEKKKERGALSPHGFFENVLLTDTELTDLSARYPHE